jgi:hypothetical protein
MAVPHAVGSIAPTPQLASNLTGIVLLAVLDDRKS